MKLKLCSHSDSETKQVTHKVRQFKKYLYSCQQDVGIQMRSSALFILKLKEKKHLTQVAIDEIVEGSCALFQQSVQRVQAGVNEKLAHAGIDPSSVEGLQDVFTELSDPYKELDSGYLQEKYFREELGMIVSKC